jgi:hypothetical protein
LWVITVLLVGDGSKLIAGVRAEAHGRDRRIEADYERPSRGPRAGSLAGGGRSRRRGTDRDTTDRDEDHNGIQEQQEATRRVVAAEKLSEDGRRPTTATTTADDSYTEEKITDELRVRKN